MTTLRRITVHMDEAGCMATNARGATLRIDADGATSFTPVELLMAALGSCGMLDVDALMRKQRDPVATMDIEVTGHKIEHRMTDLLVAYSLDGDHDARKVARALTKTSDDLCTVSRTLRSGTEVTHRIAR